jgi:hypothetical protein
VCPDPESGKTRGGAADRPDPPVFELDGFGTSVALRSVMTDIFVFPRIVVVGVLLAAVAAPPCAFAQAPGTRLPVANNQVVSTNPFLLMFEYGNVEYERKHTESGTFGGSLSFRGGGSVDYTNVQGFYRYYPQNAALTGFYLGGRGGVHRLTGRRDSAHVFGAGFEIGYSWLFGAERHFAVSLGAGATRLFGGDLEGASVVIPTLRLVNIGWSF